MRLGKLLRSRFQDSQYSEGEEKEGSKGAKVAFLGWCHQEGAVTSEGAIDGKGQHTAGQFENFLLQHPLLLYPITCPVQITCMETSHRKAGVNCKWGNQCSRSPEPLNHWSSGHAEQAQVARLLTTEIS